MFLRGEPFYYELKLMISRGGAPFTLYVDEIQGRIPFYYVLKLMMSRGGASFTQSVDVFKGRRLFYNIC